MMNWVLEDTKLLKFKNKSSFNVIQYRVSQNSVSGNVPGVACDDMGKVDHSVSTLFDNTIFIY